jgi:fructose-1,6-bisphosphatase/inositol monophosphatase family enzyme
MFDAFVNAGQKGHELAAGYLLVSEGGGVLRGFAGEAMDERRYEFGETCQVIAACNASMAEELVRRIGRHA